MTPSLIHTAICIALATVLAGCGMGTSRPAAGFTAPPPLEYAHNAAPAASDGAIFQAAHGYAALHEGTRARRVGDVVTILLVENIGSSKNTTAQTSRSGSASITPPTAGLLSFLNPNALKAASNGSFKGQGNAAQSSSLNGAITVTIAAVRPNGTARVVGEKQMSLSQGQEWVQFAGTIRLADIDGDNQLYSSQVAEAQIIYSGNGAVQRASRPGWLSRFFSLISPF